MALFSSKSSKQTKAVAKPRVPKEASAATPQASVNVFSVLLSPRITEKATLVAERNIYTFNVAPKSTKREVAAAIQALYKVTPLKVRMITIRPRKVSYRGKPGTKAGGRKAYVHLKAGDKIELI